MAESGLFNLGFRLDIKQILLEAQNRWLRPAEICEILRNYEKFHISPEAPNKPVSGSVFLFNRKVFRYFRKDGHNWRKKRDGKTVKEAHEKLKVGSVDMLNCYYAHGENDENLQRRSYWLLESDLMHIVFVHYLEVKGNRTNFSYVRNSDRVVSSSENDSSLSSSLRGTSASSTLTSAYEDVESESSHQASSRLYSYAESLLVDDSHSAQSSSYNQILDSGTLNYSSLLGININDRSSLINGAQATDGLTSWQEVKPDPVAGEIDYGQESRHYLPSQANWQVLNEFLYDKSIPSHKGTEVGSFCENPDQKELSGQRNPQMFLSDTDSGNATNLKSEDRMAATGNENYSYHLIKPLISGLQTEDSLKKVDSFSRWIAKELGEADDLDLQSSNGISWTIMGSEYDPTISSQLQVDTHALNPSISQDQLFSIRDFSPKWAYSTLETKVLATGRFLKSRHELSNCQWSIMFGEMEVCAEVVADGILCCCAPLQNPGLVPFYITCSNRLACSELREFEYRTGSDQNIGSLNANGDSAIVMHLYQRFDLMLHRGSIGSPINSAGNDFKRQSVTNEIISLMGEDDQVAELSEYDVSHLKTGEILLEKHLKEMFYTWLLSQAAEDGNGLTKIDESGQNVLHLAAALGFNWALQPIIVSGVSIDFRDVNGWTALHWAAFYGREDTVAVLVSLGASPGALTDPSAEFPLGRTPADLASSSGHKGISGFLAETSLTSHLSTLRVNDGGTAEASGFEPIQTVSERLAVPKTEADIPDTLSLKDSLAAVRNAAQAAAHIHQIFRVQSFQRKKLVEQVSEPDTTSLVAAKSSRLGHSDGMVNAAALHIQKKYRGWKKRKEYLLIRQKIVRIQAHVRGHQARKKYKPIIWSVGILEKVILRWRRKGSGLRGFRSDAVRKEPNVPPLEDDYDVLKEGRKQTEERMQKALARVKSMAQYPDGRAQYRRLLTAAEGLRENKDASDMVPDNMVDMMNAEEDLIDVSSLLDDDIFMSLAFELSDPWIVHD